jgi:hypothetical protein
MTKSTKVDPAVAAAPKTWQQQLYDNAHAAPAPGEPAASLTAEPPRESVRCPSDVRAELEKVMALGRLKKAAQALLEENTEVARASHRQPGIPWSDALWRREDPENARLCIELRRALKACSAW